jgi:transcription initiation factor IIE alpha subunit
MGKSIPKRSRNTDDMALGTIAFGLDKLEKGVTGREVYYCTKCNQRISFDTNSQPPLVCKRCGEEFDWGSLDKRKVKYALHVIKNMISMTCIARIILLQ